jgi:hypothetical protein
MCRKHGNFLEMSFDFWHFKKKWNTWQEYLIIYLFWKNIHHMKKICHKKENPGAKAKAKATTSRWMACFNLSKGWN